ncbi:MAG TPA: prolyl oligopeptidase family serine peptidase [Burkholderiaceae bacterium]|jgi:predicted dienelactone hydrolase|nr:prolyl oligopeptidase family serine peptidase [Burkholderiaceae bacterium]
MKPRLMPEPIMRTPATWNRFTARLGALALATMANLAAAQPMSMGVAELSGVVEGDGPITLFYPSRDPAQTLRRGPFELQGAPRGEPVRGNGRLVVLSHGSGGSPWTYTALAQVLVRAGYLVAVPDHVGDNHRDLSDAGPRSWERRPLEVSRAIDAVQQSPRFGPLVDAARVGVWGMSAGGHTALTLAGGRWSRERLLAHCEANLDEDWSACTGARTEPGSGFWFGIQRAIARFLIRQNLGGDPRELGHVDPRIGAIVAGVPVAADFDLATLVTPRVPLAVTEGPQDRWLVPRFHSGALLAACASCERLDAPPGAGHGALLDPPPPGLPPRIHKLLDDPPGFERAALPDYYARVVAFFNRNLLAP